MPLPMRVLVLVAALGCARRLAPPPHAAPPAPGAGASVSLLWSGPVDLDLYVTDPTLETLYFANRRTANGGLLARDARCADGRFEWWTERADWTAPPPGRYRVGVDFPEACDGRTDAAAFRVVVDVNGRREERTGVARRRERALEVLEFEVEGPSR